MEASRLVFVSVKNAKPRRKVAVPVPDAYTWEQFCQQVQTKLKLRGVGSIYLVSSGEQMTGLDELQDIDELYVEEAASPTLSATPPLVPNGPSQDRPASGSKASTSGAYTNGATRPGEALSPKGRSQQRHSMSPDGVDAREPEQKYVKRSSGVRRSLQRVLPSFFSPTLPVTSRDAQEDGRKGPRRRRRRDSFFAPRNLLRVVGLLLFIMILVFLYARMVPRLE